MKIEFTKHALRKKETLQELGWSITLESVKTTVEKPDFLGKTKKNQSAALKSLDENHSLRVVYEVRNDIIMVITFYITRKGRYET